MKSSAKRIAVIDLGSNSLHLSVYETLGQSALKLICTSSEATLIAQKAGLAGVIPPHVEPHLKTILQRFCKKAERKKSIVILLVATAVFRQAKNGSNVLKRLEAALKRRIYLLKQDRESSLGFNGAAPELRAGMRQIFIDCGGGSTEISFTKGTRRINKGSIPLGNANLSSTITNDPPSALDIIDIGNKLVEYIRRLPRTDHAARAVISGGTLEDLLRIAGRKSETEITIDDLNRAILKILKKSAEKLAKKYKLNKHKVRNLLPAAIMTLTLLKRYNLSRAFLTDKGLREGVVQAYLRHPSSWWSS